MSTDAGAVQSDVTEAANDGVDTAPEAQPTEAKAEDSKATESKETAQPKEEAKADEPKRHPWDDELDQLGLTGRMRESIHGMMLKNQQYTTSKEQELAELLAEFDLGDGAPVDSRTAASEMAQLMKGLRDEGTKEDLYYQLGETLGLFSDLLQEGAEEGEGDTAQPQEEGEVKTYAEKADDEQREFIQELMNKDRQDREEQEFQALVDEVKGSLESPDAFNEDLFLKLIVANTDVDAGKVDFEAVLQDMRQYNPEAFTAAKPQEEAPPTSTERSGSVSPPERTQPSSIGDALEDFFAEQKAARP